MTRARYLVGDVFDRLAEIPDSSVDLDCPRCGQPIGEAPHTDHVPGCLGDCQCPTVCLTCCWTCADDPGGARADA